jgi:hypothetical protein
VAEHVSWTALAPRAMAFRLAHIAFAAVQLLGLGYVWFSGLARHRDRLLGLSVAGLAVEGVALVAGGGNCPFGSLQRQLGDPVPLFELVLPPRAAKAAIPALTIVALGGLLVVGLRPPVRN